MLDRVITTAFPPTLLARLILLLAPTLNALEGSPLCGSLTSQAGFEPTSTVANSCSTKGFIFGTLSKLLTNVRLFPVLQ